MNIDTFLYYIHVYHNEINGGGTYKQVELIKEFRRYESEEKVNRLIEEAELISKQLNVEDWEMEPILLNLCNTYGKRHLKSITKIILAE
ncbi:hypothetical protein [Niallia endozanthoxylica]|uniref:Uncharacterized protein n=1 Tax=Niallia endozanthoxylica TaxID=2036016 RepID=A0A5J5HC66_9BACI|nr:hypothetical protein [Niallia endozanthoxylica]KAA9018346.1 hypothetical protein F4V44_20275 [Niallia endozanthoxylica]